MAVVLVVDDSLYTRRVHGRILTSGGHEVLEAGSGAQALETFSVKHPDLVLLDLTMADMGGLEVLAKLRELAPDPRVVVISADVQRSTEKLVLEAGAAAFLGKPVEADALLATIARSLSPS